MLYINAKISQIFFTENVFYNNVVLFNILRQVLFKFSCAETSSLGIVGKLFFRYLANCKVVCFGV